MCYMCNLCLISLFRPQPTGCFSFTNLSPALHIMAYSQGIVVINKVYKNRLHAVGRFKIGLQTE